MVAWYWLIVAAFGGYCLAWVVIFLWPEYLFSYKVNSKDSDNVTSQYDSTED